MEDKEKQSLTTHTLIISDLHLGSSVSRVSKISDLIKSYSFKKLILLGDVFDSLDFRNFSKECWELLEYIGDISTKKKVRWVEGNHDQGLSQIFRVLVGARIYKNYVWEYNHKKYLAIHGHQFDRFLVNNKFLSYLSSDIYNYIQKVDTEKKTFSHFIRNNSKGWLRLSDKVSRSAIKYAKKRKVDYIFCGHTHKPMQKTKDNVTYFNSGCWNDTPCTYITIDEDDIKIHEY